MENATKKNNLVQPKISIIVACYKGGDLLPRCLESLTKQTLREIEIICVNDGSPDNTAEVMAEWHARDERIVVINLEKNGGVSHARNVALDAATAEYVTFCDADDYKDLTFCEKMYQAITKNRADLVICGTQIVYEVHSEMKHSDENYYSLKFAGKQIISDEVILNTDLSPWNKLFRREVIQENNIRFPEGLYYEDEYFCVAYFCVAKSAYFVNEQLHTYVRQANSTMSNTWSKDKSKDNAIDHLYIAFRLYDFLEQHHILNRSSGLYWQIFIVFGYFAIENSKSRQRVRQVRKEAKEFVRKHGNSLARVDESIRDQIKIMVSPRINLTKIKFFVLRFMPTYRLQNMNMVALNEIRNGLENLSK